MFSEVFTYFSVNISIRIYGIATRKDVLITIFLSLMGLSFVDEGFLNDITTTVILLTFPTTMITNSMIPRGRSLSYEESYMTLPII